MPPRVFTHYPDHDDNALRFRAPVALDGPAITALIAACPPLDGNSAYCNLLQCSHFADTCIIAEQDGAVAGWISGYRPPSEPNSLFIWQVAVAQSARGKGLARKMIARLLERPSAEGVTHLITTITPDNAASWKLFEGFARSVDAALHKAPHFDKDTHFAGAHETEWLARIGPLPTRNTTFI